MTVKLTENNDYMDPADIIYNLSPEQVEDLWSILIENTERDFRNVNNYRNNYGIDPEQMKKIWLDYIKWVEDKVDDYCIEHEVKFTYGGPTASPYADADRYMDDMYVYTKIWEKIDTPENFYEFAAC